MINNSICLIGFMGSGKSTVGYILSNTLNCDFVDLDAHIENKIGLSISQIFSVYGEAEFRKLEAKYLEELLNKKEIRIIALGGGTACIDGIWKQLAESTTVYIKTGVSTLQKRLENQTNNLRPLIEGMSNKVLFSFINKKMKERRACYTKANYTVLSIGTAEDVARRILLRL